MKLVGAGTAENRVVEVGLVDGECSSTGMMKTRWKNRASYSDGTRTDDGKLLVVNLRPPDTNFEANPSRNGCAAPLCSWVTAALFLAVERRGK